MKGIYSFKECILFHEGFPQRGEIYFTLVICRGDSPGTTARLNSRAEESGNLLNENATLSQFHDPAVTVLNQMYVDQASLSDWRLKSVCLFADSCTLLDYSEGTLAGKECGLVKRFGIPKKEVFGGQKFDLKVHCTSRAAPALAEITFRVSTLNLALNLHCFSSA